MSNRIVIITGASSGIGLAACKLFLEKGDRVYGVSRRPCPEEGVVSLPADITDEEAVRGVVTEVVSREGRIDVLVCNAGFGISGAVEFTDMSEAKRQFDVNFFGTANCIKAALEPMRRNSPVSNTRSKRTWVCSGNSPTSSRKRVPPSAISK